MLERTKNWILESDPAQRAKLGLAIAVSVIAIVVVAIQIFGSRPAFVEMKPEEIAAAKEAARAADLEVLAGLPPQALKDELERRTSIVEEIRAANDPARLQHAEEALARLNEVMKGKKK